jgi:hypothetical protein
MLVALGLALLVVIATPAAHAEEPPGEASAAFLGLLGADPTRAAAALAYLDQNWHEGFVAMGLDIIRFLRTPTVAATLVSIMERRTGESHGFDLDGWYRWLWRRDPTPHREYVAFRRTLYGLIDERFEAYFDDGRRSTIRLDEVIWGGVRQDGIPPLRQPTMIGAEDAGYLADTDVVFGLALNGDVRAYPQRILGWHEMFVDVVGGVPIAGVYCTLCGTVIIYETEHRGTIHALGTSGFLFRSNKLMYARATSSLWSTMWGRPVLGPLVGEDIVLARRSVVTTTWGEWRRRHPGTTVLSLQTGYERDYAEGAAYREYFASPELMFPVPGTDDRLRHKDEVLGLLMAAHPDEPLAISAAFLAEHPVLHERIGELEIVVLTDSGGANRVYDARGVRFSEYDGNAALQDERGRAWVLSETALRSEDGLELPRLPAHRAFWFGWFGAFSHTRLVH